MDLWIVLVLAIAGVAVTIEVHFENKDGGFFLKHTSKQYYSAVADLSAVQENTEQTPKTTLGSNSVVLSLDRFTIFQTSQPVSIRATYGPFSTKQTVPARYIVPDFVDYMPLPDSSRNVSSSSSAFMDLDLASTLSHNLDISAHMVRTEIPRDSPVLRVLFHTGSDPVVRRQLSHNQKICITLHATMGDRTPLTATCSPDGEDGVCLAQITIPASWWPPLPPPESSGKSQKFVKTPQRYVQVAYSVLEPSYNPKSGGKCVPKVQIQPVTPLAAIPLVPARETYREIKADDTLIMLLPHAPLYPLSRVHLPVFFQSKPKIPITAFDMRARVKSGLRIIGVEPSSQAWNVTFELNGKQTVASVSCFKKDEGDVEDSKKSIAGFEEIFSWQLEVVENGEDLWDGGRIVWSARYMYEGFKPPKGRLHHHRGSRRISGAETIEDSKKKLTARLDIQKDDIQSVLPISKNWEVINTAVLTGRQVSQAMKVLIVSQAGKVADITLQSSCHSEDESVLKISSSCSSVYVDGSEIRGSSNASVLVKYGTYTGLAKFKVWMPEFPLEVNVPDFRLSQIKGWKVADESNATLKFRKKRSTEPRAKRFMTDGKIPYRSSDDGANGIGDADKHPSCRLRFQQSPIEVYARFLAEDHDTGRVNYFVNRRTWLRVTDLVQSLLRVSDPRIASLRGKIIQGRSVGRTEVQILSPITGRVIGAKEVRVGNDKVTLLRLHVNVVSGLQLSITPDSTIENGYIAETSVTRKLTAQYQEGLLDIELEFSDESKTPLRDVAVSDYYLLVDSLDPDVVAFAPMVASYHPRVIAVGEGKGNLLRVALLPSDECRKLGKSSEKPGGGYLAETKAAIEVDFGAGEVSQHSEFVQNDGSIGMSSRDRRIKSDLGEIFHIQGPGMPPLKDENNHEPTVQARQHHSGTIFHSGFHNRHPNRMTPLEIGMYVLLAAFCFAIVVFVVSCVVYASKFKAQIGENGETVNAEDGAGTNLAHTRETNIDNRMVKGFPQSTTNVHDWVWLGRASLDQSVSRTSERSLPFGINEIGKSNDYNGNSGMRITENPFNANDATCCMDNFEYLNKHQPGLVDTTTYSKNSARRHVNHVSDVYNEFYQVSPQSPMPPPPPHGAVLLSDEYKPPVPPHRTSVGEQEVEYSPPKKHHHHHNHHHRNKVRNRSSKHETGLKNSADRYDEGLVYDQRTEEGVDIISLKKTPSRMSTENLKSDKTYPSRQEHSSTMSQFVENLNGDGMAGSDRLGHLEVKKATIIGNPMFSFAGSSSSSSSSPAPLATGPKSQEDVVGLDDLNLGMNYDQIMQYFDNLKESNA